MKGYIALISVIVIGAITTGIATTLLFYGIILSQSGLNYQQSNQAKAAANACAEDALQKIRDDNNYTGTSNLTLTNGETCSAVVTNTGGSNRKIEAQGLQNDNTRRLQIVITQVNPKIIINSWSEVGTYF